MERKDLFINNDLSMMLSRELASAQEKDAEWEKEQERIRKDAEKAAENPAAIIDAKTIMARGIRYAGTDEYFLKLFTEGSDEEQLTELRSLEYVVLLTLLPDAIFVAGYNLIKKADYAKWTEILFNLHYVPLQMAFCYCLKSHRDFCNVLKTIDVRRLDYPQTFLLSLLDHWFEWLTRASGHLISYDDERRNYDKNPKAQELKKEGQAVKEEWEKELPVMIHEIMGCFALHLQSERILAWATNEPLRDDTLSNPYSASYNRCIYQIWDDLSKVVQLNSIPEKDLNLNMLLLMANKAVEDHDEAYGKEVYEKLTGCLIRENFSNMEKKSKVEEKRQRTIAKLMVLIKPDLDFGGFVNGVATRFQGWNLDYQQVYAEARREAYLICCLFRVFEIQTVEDSSLFPLWKNLVDVYLHEYRRCDNEYILRDDFTVPFRVAVEVAAKLKDDGCRDYLHEVMLENILSIVALLTVFSECSMTLADNIVKWLLQRIEIEWPSAKMLMEVRGQRMLEERIENLIGQLKKGGEK